MLHNLIEIKIILFYILTEHRKMKTKNIIIYFIKVLEHVNQILTKISHK